MPAASAVVLLRLMAIAFAIVVVIALWEVLADPSLAGRFARPAMVAFAIGMLLVLAFAWRMAPLLVRLATPKGIDDGDGTMDGGTLFASGAALLGLWELLVAISPVVTLASLAADSEVFPLAPPEVIAEPVIRLLVGAGLIAFAGPLGRWFRRSINRQGLP